MEIKNMLASILVEKIPKYLNYTYQEMKVRLNECYAITELVDLSEKKQEYWAQIELNPIYENFESKDHEIVCNFLISDGKYELSCTICFPQTGAAYCGDTIFDASGSKLPEKYCSINL